MTTFLTVALALLAVLPPEALVISPMWWEIAKGVLLFAITGILGFIAKGFWSMSRMVVDHELAIYGRNGENGLKRGLTAIEGRVNALDDRFIAMDAVALVEAERATYPGPERRHSPLHVIVERVRQELLDEERRRQ